MDEDGSPRWLRDVVDGIFRGQRERLSRAEIQRRIEQQTGESLRIEEGALYPALRRLERDGMVTSGWGVSAATWRSWGARSA